MQRSPLFRRAAAFCFLLAALGLGGCGPAADPLDRPVDASSSAAYRHWLYRHAASLGPDAESELIAAVNQLKLRAQIEQAGLPPEMITLLVRQQIHGLTPRELLTQAHLWTWRHLDEQNRMDDLLFERNATYPLLPDAGDPVVQRFREHMDDIRQRQDQRRQEMRRLEDRLKALNPGVDVTRLLRPTPEALPANMPPPTQV